MNCWGCICFWGCFAHTGHHTSVFSVLFRTSKPKLYIDPDKISEETAIGEPYAHMLSYYANNDSNAVIIVREAAVQKYMFTYHIEGQFHFIFILYL